MFSKAFPFNITHTYSLARVFITLSILTTLLLNSNNVIFPEYAFENFEKTDGIHWIKNINLFYIMGFKYIVLIKSITISALFIFLFGFFPRIGGVLLFYITNSFLNFSPIVEGGDVICSNLSFMLIPISFMDNRNFLYDFSVNIIDNTLKKIIANNVFLFIQIQVAFIYLNACMGKLYVNEWVNGTAIYYYASPSIYGFGIYNDFVKGIIDNGIITVLFTWGSLLIEFLLFACLFIKDKKIKIRMFWIGVLFHFTIILVFGLVTFFFAMIASLILYLCFKYEKIDNYDKN